MVSDSETVDFSEVWLRSDGARARPARSWKNVDGWLELLERTGSPPPDPDEEAPDHEVTLTEVILASHRHDAELSPDQRARKEARLLEERRNFDLNEYRRVCDAKVASHRTAWAEFKRRNDLDFPPA